MEAEVASTDAASKDFLLHISTGCTAECETSCQVQNYNGEKKELVSLLSTLVLKLMTAT